MEYRQAELRLEQLYTQIRMQVVNAQFALTNDRAQVQASNAARDYNSQSLDSEVKKLRLGASTTANVLLQQRNLAAAEDNLIAANAAYAKDRAGLYQILATTLQHYGINLSEAASGNVKTIPVVPGLTPARAVTSPRPLRRPPARADRPAKENPGPLHSKRAGIFFWYIRANKPPKGQADPVLPLRHQVSRSKNSGKLMAADSAPRISVSPSARNAATLKAMAMRWSPPESIVAPCSCVRQAHPGRPRTR